MRPASCNCGFTKVGSNIRPEPNLKDVSSKCYGQDAYSPLPFMYWILTPNAMLFGGGLCGGDKVMRVSGHRWDECP